MKDKDTDISIRVGFLKTEIFIDLRCGCGELLLAKFTGGRIVRQASAVRASIMKPVIRTVQPKPISARSLFKAMGQITPPREEPETTIPRARPRLALK